MDELAQAQAHREKLANEHLGYVALALIWDRRADFFTDPSDDKCVVVFSSAKRLTDYLKVIRDHYYPRERFWRVLLAEDDLQDFRKGVEEGQKISRFVLDPPAFGTGDPRDLAELDAALGRIVSDQPGR